MNVNLSWNVTHDCSPSAFRIGSAPFAPNMVCTALWRSALVDRFVETRGALEESFRRRLVIETDGNRYTVAGLPHDPGSLSHSGRADVFRPAAFYDGCPSVDCASQVHGYRRDTHTAFRGGADLTFEITDKERCGFRAPALAPGSLRLRTRP